MKNLTNNEKSTVAGGFICNHDCTKISDANESKTCELKHPICSSIRDFGVTKFLLVTIIALSGALLYQQLQEVR